MQTPATVPTAAVNAYLTAFYSGDFTAARAAVADDFSFTGPFITAQGADSFFESAQALVPIVRGHRLLHQWEDGADVCSFYEATIETPAGAGAILMSEWHTVRDDGRIATGRVVFDSAAFRKIVPPAVQ